MEITVKYENSEYRVAIGKGLLSSAGEIFSLNRKVFILTDDGVPARYAETIAKQAYKPFIHTIKSGEASKNLTVYSEILEKMLFLGFTRTDCVVAVGGGVVGDLAGFVAATFMRGIDF